MNWESIMSGIIANIICEIGKGLMFGDVKIPYNYTLDRESFENFRELVKKNEVDTKDPKEVQNFVTNNINTLNINYKTEFAMRLDYAISTMNVNRYKDSIITIAKLCEDMGETSINTIKKYYFETSEPEFDFIERVAKRIGINADWLKGKGKQPFYIENEDKIEIQKFVESDDYNFKNYNGGLNIIINCNGEECGEQNDTVIIQKKDFYKYFIWYNYTQPFELCNPCPGDSNYSGNKSTIQFCRLLYNLKQKQWEWGSGYKSSWVKDSSFQDYVYFVPNEVFNDLINGIIYPESILNQIKCEKGYMMYYLFDDERIDDNDQRIPYKYRKWFLDLKDMTDRIGVNKWYKKN